MSEKKSIVKKRHWAFVAYPESAPANWREILQQTGLQCAISPLHDKDVDPDGQLKKAHYHVILAYNGPTASTVVQKITDGLNAPIPQALEQLKGYYRYLTHKDNPEKVQYDEKDIECINGFSIRDYIDLTKSEVTNLKRELMRFIEENDITEYCDLLTELDKHNMADAWEVAANNTIFADAYVRSRRHKLEKIKNERSEQ